MEEIPRRDGRHERSRRTRAAIVASAGRLFVEHGYVATTIEQIAEDAGISPQTIYTGFGQKAHVLSAVVDATIVGDDDPIGLAARDWFVGIARTSDRDAAFAAFVDGAVDVLARMTPLYDVVVRAAAEPGIGELVDENRGRRRQDQRRLVELLVEGGHVRPGLDIDAAADVVYALASEDVYRMLTVECSWSRDRYRDWLAAVLTVELR